MIIKKGHVEKIVFFRGLVDFKVHRTSSIYRTETCPHKATDSLLVIDSGSHVI